MSLRGSSAGSLIRSASLAQCSLAPTPAPFPDSPYESHESQHSNALRSSQPSALLRSTSRQGSLMRSPSRQGSGILRSSSRGGEGGGGGKEYTGSTIRAKAGSLLRSSSTSFALASFGLSPTPLPSMEEPHKIAASPSVTQTSNVDIDQFNSRTTLFPADGPDSIPKIPLPSDKKFSIRHVILLIEMTSLCFFVRLPSFPDCSFVCFN